MAWAEDTVVEWSSPFIPQHPAKQEWKAPACYVCVYQRKGEMKLKTKYKLTRHTMATAWFEDSSLAAMESPNRSQRSTHVIITYSDKQQDEAQALGPSLQQHIDVCNSELAIWSKMNKDNDLQGTSWHCMNHVIMCTLVPASPLPPHVFNGASPMQPEQLFDPNLRLPLHVPLRNSNDPSASTQCAWTVLLWSTCKHAMHAIALCASGSSNMICAARSTTCIQQYCWVGCSGTTAIAVWQR